MCCKIDQNDNSYIDIDEESISNMFRGTASNNESGVSRINSDIDISEDRQIIENYLEDILTFKR